MAAVGSLPGVLANMLNTLPLISNEPCVRAWKQQAGWKQEAGPDKVPTPTSAAAAAQSYIPDDLNQAVQPSKDPQQQHTANSTGPAGSSKGSCSKSKCRSVMMVQDEPTLRNRPYSHVSQGSRSLKARNARLEVLLASGGAVDVQVCKLLGSHVWMFQ